MEKKNISIIALDLKTMKYTVNYTLWAGNSLFQKRKKLLGVNGLEILNEGRQSQNEKFEAMTQVHY